MKVSEEMELSPIFVSHKEVKRLTMTKGSYNVYRGWETPDDEDRSEVGYMIEYLDGGKPNHPEHEGYISWSPKEQFDNGYTKVLEDYQQRVVEEKAELDNKLTKLNIFLTENAAKMDCSNLANQRDHMFSYSVILANRISLF